MRVLIERFKNIQALEIELDGLTLLVGGNNAGKSSVLQAIQFGTSVAQTSQMQGGTWEADRLATSIGQSDLVYSPIKDVLSLGPNGRLREPDAEAIRITYRDGANEARVSVRKGRNKNVRLELVGQGLGSQLQSIQEPFSALVTGLAGIPSEEEFETNIVVRKSAAKGDSNSVFRNILLQLNKDPNKWADFQAQVLRLFPGYVIDVRFDPDSDETIQCSVTRNGTQYPIDTCGTGVLQAIQIFSYINLFSPKILLLDEPDSHLHPNNQKQLARELIRASDAGINVVVSTHSKHLVEAMLESARLVWLRNGVVQPDVEDYEIKALLDVGALNVGERIGNPETIFLTEDKNHEILEVFLEANGVDLEDCDIVSYAGCTQIGTATALISHLRKLYPNARYILHRDRDFLTNDALNAFSARFQAMNVRVFIPTGNDLEAYFCSPTHLSAICAIDDGVAGQIVQEAFEARRNDLTEKYVNTRIENLRKAGEQVNAGAIAVEAANELNGPASAATHGKTLLRGVRAALQARNIPGQLVAISPALTCARVAAALT